MINILIIIPCYRPLVSPIGRAKTPGRVSYGTTYVQLQGTEFITSLQDLRLHESCFQTTTDETVKYPFYVHVRLKLVALTFTE